MRNKSIIIILDFGSQYTQLITRRIREFKVHSVILPFNTDLEKILKLNPGGIILSGGPTSVYEFNAPKIKSEIFNLKIPILGICYGMQIIADQFNGKVEPADSREYGKSKLTIIKKTKILNKVKNNSIVWMSHGDIITKVPKGFQIDARSENSPVCMFSNDKLNIYGLQFHPEVIHTVYGKQIIQNFLFNICNCEPSWTPQNIIENSINELKNKLQDEKVICALSGGVDSSVAAILMHKAIGKNLICIHVDNGLMRKNESKNIIELFEKNYNLNIIYINAEKLFLSKLKGISDPEKKRKIIGNTFIEVFEKEAKKIKNVKYLVQGTLYPDVIESANIGNAAHKIKTHHNVGGLPARMKLKLIEPFRELFKDEVREIGKLLGLPSEFVYRHPFPGPGLAVRVLGEITKSKLDLLRSVDDIFITELKSHYLYHKIWQAFAVLLPIQSVGVMGDARTYESVVALRAITSDDGMTADWFRFDYEFLVYISNKIIREVNGVNRITYDISSKPPATIEWE